MKKQTKKPGATAPSKPGKPCSAPSAGNSAPTPAPRPKRALTGRGAAGPTKPPAPAQDPDVETRAFRRSSLLLGTSSLVAVADVLARLAAEDERAIRWRRLLQVERPETSGEDGARRADFARQAAEALGWPGWATYERDGRFDPLCGNLPLLYATGAVETVTARPSMLGVILAALRERAKPVADLDRIRAAAAEGSIPGEWHLLDYAGPVYEIPEPRPGTEYARLVAAREAQEAAASQVLADAAAGRLGQSREPTKKPHARPAKCLTEAHREMARAFLHTRPDLPLTKTGKVDARKLKLAGGWNGVFGVHPDEGGKLVQAVKKYPRSFLAWIDERRKNRKSPSLRGVSISMDFEKLARDVATPDDLKKLLASVAYERNKKQR